MSRLCRAGPATDLCVPRPPAAGRPLSALLPVSRLCRAGPATDLCVPRPPAAGRPLSALLPVSRLCRAGPAIVRAATADLPSDGRCITTDHGHAGAGIHRGGDALAGPASGQSAEDAASGAVRGAPRGRHQSQLAVHREPADGSRTGARPVLGRVPAEQETEQGQVSAGRSGAVWTVQAVRNWCWPGHEKSWRQTAVCLHLSRTWRSFCSRFSCIITRSCYSYMHCDL